MATGPQKPGVRDLVLRAASDPKFADTLLANPEKFAQHYNLSKEQITNIERLAGQGALRPVVSRPGRGAAGGGYY